MFTTVHVICMLMETVHVTALIPKIYVPSDNVTVHFDQLDIDELNILEITFSGYTNKLHVTNVMLYTPMKNETDLNSNYTGRIPCVNLDKGHLSFILLNVSFIDSGNYTVVEHSLEKGKTSIIVPHHRIIGQHNEPAMLSFTCNITNVTLIKIQMMLSTLQHVVLKYDVTRENNTEVDDLYRYRIEGCEVNENNFSFTFRKVSWADLGVYVAWSDTNILMDSVLLEFEDHNSTSSPERTPIYFTSSSVPTTLKLMAENYMLEWIFISAVVVLLLAAGVIVNTLRRNRPKSKITSIHLTYMNGRQSIANSSCSRSNNTEIRYTIDGSTMPLRLNNCSHALTDLSHAQTQGMIPNGKQSCNQGEYSVHTTVRKDMMHPSLSSSCETSESDSTFDDCDQYDEMPNEYQYEKPHFALK
ncbi:hypothetical protein ACJMK2_024917 [Sinanodonta woodiana]|uniref:Uncharacterized protein n=1 Tax=Sinanodonta woodiana TaxID=1069815 RepID=A0ABD3XGW0_SINWO